MTGRSMYESYLKHSGTLPSPMGTSLHSSIRIQDAKRAGQSSGHGGAAAEGQCRKAIHCRCALRSGTEDQVRCCRCLMERAPAAGLGDNRSLVGSAVGVWSRTTPLRTLGTSCKTPG